MDSIKFFKGSDYWGLQHFQGHSVQEQMLHYAEKFDILQQVYRKFGLSKPVPNRLESSAKRSTTIYHYHLKLIASSLS